MSDSKRWHVTHLGSEKSPMVWKLEGSQAIVFGFSLGAALFVFRFLMDGFGWSLWGAVATAGLLPATVLTVLLTLVKGKPKGHFKRWLEWQVLKVRSEELLVERANGLAVVWGKLCCHFKRENQESDSLK